MFHHPFNSATPPITQKYPSSISCRCALSSPRDPFTFRHPRFLTLIFVLPFGPTARIHDQLLRGSDRDVRTEGGEVYLEIVLSVRVFGLVMNGSSWPTIIFGLSLVSWPLLTSSFLLPAHPTLKFIPSLACVRALSQTYKHNEQTE